eukprot:Gregarina_sp_Pseudo_9__1596@NODE_2075_length_1168_cov_17_923826_g1916_i0_p1_GENE_NODE_2075_length_1168_cov_17_923826_g1916_i0NODE_2075_length_1168_cov_17_923826_g1916_i0_p1_ORF_typecomplete_len298_score56_13TPR_MalT/PF17874_1/0_055_NODE_2075_length_1168_cov_17_923826_g1916_i01771070
MDFSNILDDVDIAAKSDTKCWETVRKAACVECGQPKDLIIMMHPQDLKALPFACEPCHGEHAIDWDAHVFDIVSKFLELGPNAWSEKPQVRAAILSRGGLVSQAGVLALLRGPPRPVEEDGALHHMLSSNIELFGKIRSVAPNDASVLRIHEILAFCSEALRRNQGEQLLNLARRISPQTREAHKVVWELVTQECYASGHYEDALRCMLYGMELREGILPPFEGSAALVLSVEELLVLSLSLPPRAGAGFNLARVSQRLGKPATAALHAYRWVANRSRPGWVPNSVSRKSEDQQTIL